jgi:mono/diheme cytochrome c family protein
MLYSRRAPGKSALSYSENPQMNHRLLILFAVAAFLPVLFITGCNKSATLPVANTKAPATATPDQFAAMRATFDKNCKSCHGETGKGGPVKLEDGTKLKVPSLCEGHALHHPDSDFVKQITKGGDGMPAFRDKLKPDEINDCIRFIRHEFQGGMMPPGEPMKMK